jgi:hypothetical protein
MHKGKFTVYSLQLSVVSCQLSVVSCQLPVERKHEARVDKRGLRGGDLLRLT